MKAKENKEKITFELELEESLANAIRRYIGEIPILAIDELEISKNDSPLYDETIAHRIGLIPLKIDKSVSKKNLGKLKFNAKKEGIVYSGDLKGNVEVVYEKIPITPLTRGQELDLIATTKIGNGNEHAKFSPGLMFYRNIFDVKVDKECPKGVVEICPKKIFGIKGGSVIVEDSSRCDMCESCLSLCEKEGKESIKITPKEQLLITLESFGQLEVKDIFKKSIDILKKDLTELGKKISR